ncbi:PepSY domain-containing protein [Butyrivibrio sp. AE3004]|uniref:PepSY domain-containing protein n=1 Tax=Butyrivibrio sp. AE3004 TaxID=1506994 RepID=UPI000494665B|nr:PepSY domain-containing protein [Butyrivibrio sp. AE3004]
MSKKAFIRFKTAASAFMAAALAIGTLAGASPIGAITGQTSVIVVQAAKKYITEKKAESIALKDAKLKKSAVEEFDEAELEKGKKPKYKLAFSTETKEYEYVIHATSGQILEAKWDLSDKDLYEEPDDDEEEVAKKAVTVDVVKKAVQKDARLKKSFLKNLKVSKATEDDDEDVTFFKVTFKNGKYKYTYEVEAYTGIVISMEKKYSGK